MPSVSSLAATTGRDFVELDVSAGAWIALLALLAVMLAVDLLRHRDDHEPTPREALGETVAWIACGLAFAGVVAAVYGSRASGEYLAGYLIEKSLSVDNVFVWSVLFTTLAIPLRYQHRVLFWGIFGALVLRLSFIVVGTALIDRFFWLLVVFGVFLVVTGVRVLRHRPDEGTGSATRALELVRRVMPVTTEYDGHAFTTRRHGHRVATPLLAAMVVVELTDVVFALDSVPAVLAVSHEPFLVFASNAFAIVGLRAMYFLLAAARRRLHHLSHGLGLVLVFVGVKMTVSHWWHLDTWISLLVIGVLLGAAVGWSERRHRREQALAAAGRGKGEPSS